MYRILTLLALFLGGAAAAQPRTATENRELPRGGLFPCATAQEAADNAATHRYRTPVEGWTSTGGRYEASFTVPFAWSNRQVLLHVESVPTAWELRINGRRAAFDCDGNTPADFNITRYVQEGRNTVAICPTFATETAPLESWKRTSAAQLGAVWLTSPATMGVRDVLVQCAFGEADRTTARAEVGIVVKSYALNPRTSRIEYELLAPDSTSVLTGYERLTLQMRGEDTIRFLTAVPDSLLWSAERPQRYTLRLRTQYEGRYVEYIELPIGFRTVEADARSLRINGREAALKLREVAPTLSVEALQQLRDEGCNAIRLTTGAAAPHLYESCDTIGLYVIAQAPIDTRSSGKSRRKGGNPSNDPAWRPFFAERVANTFHTTKRHPSVIAFSIADDSANGICLYEAYLGLKALDDPRPILYPAAAGEWNTDPFITR